jgi:hypothetical protein
MSKHEGKEAYVSEGPSLTIDDVGVWRLTHPQYGELMLPPALGKMLRFSLRLTHFHELNSARERRLRTQATHLYQRMDCHTFVAKCLGFSLPIKYVKLAGYSAHKRFFSPEQFKLHSGDETSALGQLEIRIAQFAQPILVGQVMRSPGDLTHSFLLLNIGNQWISLEKSGTGGKFNMRHLPDALDAWRKSYGCHIALAPYSEISNRADLHEWYIKPHFSY